jgi:hypothetical protein
MLHLIPSILLQTGILVLSIYNNTQNLCLDRFRCRGVTSGFHLTVRTLFANLLIMIHRKETEKYVYLLKFNLVCMLWSLLYVIHEFSFAKASQGAV